MQPSMKKPVEILHGHGEPERLCGNREHFDGGGLRTNNWPVNEDGDCHNGISGMFTTKAHAPACKRGFYPCTTRWPIERLFNPEAYDEAKRQGRI